jgi:hypothetical protein
VISAASAAPAEARDGGGRGAAAANGWPQTPRFRGLTLVNRIIDNPVYGRDTSMPQRVQCQAP